MKRLMAGIVNFDKLLYIISGIILCFMVLLTLCDVILRNFGHPITGSNEFMMYGGCIVFSFSVPYATFMKAQIIVDIFTEKLNPENQRIMSIITRIVGIALFLFIAYNCIVYGIDVKKTHEATAYFRIPYYPFAYVIALAFLFQGFTIFCDLVQKIKGGNNE
jgi:TRAP-type transport system small permease protein